MNNIYTDRFKDKVIIVTGATSGIGKETAIRAAMEGGKVVLAGRREKLGNEVIAEIKEKGGNAIFVQADLSREEDAAKLIKEAVNTYGKIDIAVNNAGIMGNPCPVHKLSVNEMDSVINSNFYSVLYCCKYEIKQFLEQNTGGIIINNSSSAGIIGVPGLPAYNASKHAVNGLTKNLAMDYAQYNIRVNSINPSSTFTPLLENAIELHKKQSQDPSEKESFVGAKQTSLLQRPSYASEQAAAILFLASNDATHMTGATVTTDGGFTTY